MENEEDETSQDNSDKKANSRDVDEKKLVAKEMVHLEHVDTKKQEISQETKELVEVIKSQGLDEDKSEELSNDEITLLESFIGKRLFLTRIAIVVNQSRIPLGIEPFKKAELVELLEGLINKGYIDFTVVEDRDVYFLTEKGKECIQ